MSIVIKQVTKYGLEVFQCYVNGTYTTEFMSRNAARAWAEKFIRKHDKAS